MAGGKPGSADRDGDRFIEMWGSVFIQFEQHAAGNRTLLPKPSVDTDMGLERVAAVLRSFHNNGDTELFKTLIVAFTGLTSNNNQTIRRNKKTL